MKESSNTREITEKFIRIKLNQNNTLADNNNFTIVFFHGTNHSCLKYNYTYETNGSVRKNYFLDKLSNVANLFLYNRPEEMLRFNYEEGKSNCGVDYPNYTIDSHITNLHKLLSHEKVKPPYVLVSHSIGSLYALKFAQKYTKDTKHVFLIDPIQYTEKISKQLYKPPISNSELEKHRNIIINPKSSKIIVPPSLLPSPPPK